MNLQYWIDVDEGLIDQPRHIRFSGLSAGEASLRAWLQGADGSRWESQARFLIGAQGELDLAKDAPQSGDWLSADAMALVWSMQQVKPPTRVPSQESLAAQCIELQLTDAKGQQIAGAFTQYYLAAGVQRREIREDGISGTLFLPEGDQPQAAVVVLNGSGGGTPQQRAALYAAHGYTALALGYFKAPGRPEHISDTPLEYFQQALEWVANTLKPKDGFIAVAGLSRGAELALLLGSYFPGLVSAVIGYVPSSVVHGTLRAGRPEQPRDANAWTWQGQPLTNVWQNNPRVDWRPFDVAERAGAPIRQAPAFVVVQQDAPSVARARIPVENINGPLLLISGDDDGFWPSAAYSAEIEADLHARGHAWPVEHVLNQGAGHAIGFPYVPTTMIARLHPVARVLISGGGTPAANALANQHSWGRVLAFLDRAVAARSSAR
ncbi:Acyl-CoA thioester hydrolase/bile acid-CoA acetyltransferase [Pseudomonas savastanoi pv. glycinea]|nr:Acyl-CoA thioester hydrolase/bile acid-CoA acetyltransferase [Pseudomonas savastanoi pv. glycinea]